MLSILINLLTILVFSGAFVFFLFNKKNISAMFLATIFPSFSSIIGLERTKTLISLGLLFITLTSALLANNYKHNLFKEDKHKLNKLKQNTNHAKFITFEIALFCLYFYFISLVSPAIGSEYFFRKFLFTNLLMIIPTFSILLLKERGDFEHLFKYAIVPICFLIVLKLLYSVYQFGFINVLASEWFVRSSTSEIANTIWMARFISIGLISAIIYIQKPAINIFVTLFLFLGIFFSGSKAVLYGSLLSIILVQIFSWISKKKDKHSMFNEQISFSKVIMIFILVSFVLYYLFSTMDPLAFARRFSLNPGTEHSTIYSRQSTIEQTLFSFNDSEAFFFGNGLATVGKSLGYGFIRYYPHNLTVELLYEMGLLGTFLFYLPFLHLLFLVFKKQKKRYKSKDFIMFTTLSIIFMLYAQTSGDLYANNYPYIFISCAVKSYYSNI